MGVNATAFNGLVAGLRNAFPCQGTRCRLEYVRPAVDHRVEFCHAEVSALRSYFFEVLDLSYFAGVCFPVPFCTRLSCLSNVVDHGVLHESTFRAAVRVVYVTFYLKTVLPSVRRQVPSAPAVEVSIRLMDNARKVLVVRGVVGAGASANVMALIFSGRIFISARRHLTMRSIVVVLVLVTLERATVRVKRSVRSPVAVVRVRCFAVVILVVTLVSLPVDRSRSFSLLSYHLSSSSDLVNYVMFYAQLNCRLCVFSIEEARSIRVGNSLSFLIVSVGREFAFTRSFCFSVLLRRSQGVFRGVFYQTRFLRKYAFCLDRRSFEDRSRELSVSFRCCFLRVRHYLLRDCHPCLACVVYVTYHGVTRTACSCCHLYNFTKGRRLTILVHRTTVCR